MNYLVYSVLFAILMHEMVKSKKILQMYRKILGLVLISSFASPALGGTYEAICSFYSAYQPCRITIGVDNVEGNLPTDYLYIDRDNFKDLRVYEDYGKSSNIVVGTVTTLLLGPIGLLGFLATKKTGTVDYAFMFNEGGRRRTAFVRFINMNVAGKFAQDSSRLVRELKRDL